MCGIVGYVGPRDAIPILIGGLEKLEYRGYDSAGVAVITEGRFEVFRREGKLAELKSLLTQQKKLSSSQDSMSNKTGMGLHVGIGHTRWATHGRPSEKNAHPHVAGKVCVVHNGIIENYVALRQRLQRLGCEFISETDTEIAAHLINVHLEQFSNLQQSSSLLAAVRSAIAELKGSYALVVISTADPSRLVVAKNSTPVIVGLAASENFVASDIPAILEHTRQVLILEDGEIAEVKADGVSIERDGVALLRNPTTITWDPVTAEKGGYRHYMLKEIYEQPFVVAETFRGRINQQEGSVFLDDVTFSDDDFRKINRICIVACGTAWHAGLVTKFYLEQLARVAVEVDYGSEFRYRSPVLDDKTLFLAISQSGETIDTLGSLSLAVESKVKTMAICNVLGSTIARKAESVLYTHAGPEISVASTKAFLTQLVAGFLLTLRIGIARGTLSKSDINARLEELIRLPAHISDALRFDPQLEKIARKYGRSHHVLFLGRGLLYPVALEGALKLKEISYLHAEGYPAGEMKHGPIALINEETPVVAVIGHDGVNYEKTVSNLKEVEARGGKVIAITDLETPEIGEFACETVAVGQIPRLLLPIVLTVPLQLLAYHIAVYRGTDVDQPRNLAKSVVVE